MRRLAALLFPALAALACDRAPPTGGSSIVTVFRDSAGVRIAESSEPPADRRLPWRVGHDPFLSIGVAEGDDPYMLYGAYSATRLNDGRIVVANSGTDELRIFDEAGRHVGTWGGQGEGPGEFTGLGHVEAWPGDSIIAWFAPRSRLSVFDDQGNHGRSFALTHPTGTSPMQRFWPWRATPDGLILAVHAPEAADTIVVQLRDGEGREGSLLGTHQGREFHLVPDSRGFDMLLWTIFGPMPVWGTWGDLVVLGRTGRYELKAYRADGSLARIVRRGHTPRSPAQADVEARIDDQLGRSSDPSEDGRNRWHAAYQSVPVAEHFPAFAEVRSDAADHLWVQEYEFLPDGRSSRLWTVFDPQGRALGLIEMPEGLDVLQIGLDYILGWTQDELGVESIQLWSLERAGDA